MIYNNIRELIGKTPLLKAGNFEEKHQTRGKIYCKLEALNPSGSVKDRPALNMILEAMESGKLPKDGVIIEPTSGNTGIALASIAASLGIKSIMVMPESMSIERRKLIKAYGAEIVLTKKELGMQGAVDKANELAKEIEGAVVLGQFDNDDNWKAHYKTTGPELLKAMEASGEKIDVIVGGFGTGGTISGVGAYFKEHAPETKIIAVEPKSSPLLTEGKAGPHKIQGIGANFVPSILNKDVIDEFVSVSNEDALEMARAFAKDEGFLVGISSGASLKVALEISQQEEMKDKNIVVILPDTGERYLSTELYDVQQ